MKIAGIFLLAALTAQAGFAQDKPKAETPEKAPQQKLTPAQQTILAQAQQISQELQGDYTELQLLDQIKKERKQLADLQQQFADAAPKPKASAVQPKK